MEIIINLERDTICYNKELKQGTLKSGLLGAEDFSIHESSDGYLIDLEVDHGERSTLWTSPCKFTDHSNQLVLNVE